MYLRLEELTRTDIVLCVFAIHDDMSGLCLQFSFAIYGKFAIVDFVTSEVLTMY